MTLAIIDVTWEISEPHIVSVIGQQQKDGSIRPWKSNYGVEFDAIRKMVASAMQVVVQCSRYHDGGRRTSHISEVLGLDSSGNYITRGYFSLDANGKNS